MFFLGGLFKGAHLDESGKHYMTVRDQQMVAIHPSSCLGSRHKTGIGFARTSVQFRFLQHKPEWVQHSAEHQILLGSHGTTVSGPLPWDSGHW